MQPRTKRQKEVLDYVTRYMDRNGHKPSYQQIARHLGVRSRAGVQRHIAALESQGLISRRRENGSFRIELPTQSFDPEAICCVELIELSTAEGEPGSPERTLVTIPREMIGEFRPDDVFGVRAPDDSMIERQICARDIVLFERRGYARRGEIVAAVADGGRVYVGLYHQHGRETEIRPANQDYETLNFPADEISVHGVMRGLIRPFPSFERSD